MYAEALCSCSYSFLCSSQHILSNPAQGHRNTKHNGQTGHIPGKYCRERTGKVPYTVRVIFLCLPWTHGSIPVGSVPNMSTLRIPGRGSDQVFPDSAFLHQCEAVHFFPEGFSSTEYSFYQKDRSEPLLPQRFDCVRRLTASVLPIKCVLLCSCP